MESLTPLLNVEDLPRSLAFYRDQLGFEVEREFAHEGELVWAQVRSGPALIMLNRSPARVARGRRTDAESYDDAILFLGVADAPALREALVAKGLDPGPVRREDYGVHEFALRDPDGYELAFTSPLDAV